GDEDSAGAVPAADRLHQLAVNQPYREAMKPRDFLTFFKTKSGKLVLFAALFGGGLVIFGVLRERSRRPDDMALAVKPARTNSTDKPQVVHSVDLPMQPFHPPAPKPEPLLVVKTNEPPKVV